MSAAPEGATSGVTIVLRSASNAAATLRQPAIAMFGAKSLLPTRGAA
jgi:hypothetical protein